MRVRKSGSRDSARDEKREVSMKIGPRYVPKSLEIAYFFTYRFKDFRGPGPDEWELSVRFGRAYFQTGN